LTYRDNDSITFQYNELGQLTAMIQGSVEGSGLYFYHLRFTESNDVNKHMTSGAGRTITYDYDNRPTSITYNGMAVVSVYDASSNRVEKVTPNSTTIYIGKLYECTNGVCTKTSLQGAKDCEGRECRNLLLSY